jgi:hypothetical protein
VTRPYQWNSSQRDCHLFTALQQDHGGHTSRGDREVRTGVTRWLLTQGTDWYPQGREKHRLWRGLRGNAVKCELFEVVHTVTCTEGEQRHSSTLSLTSAMDGVGTPCHAAAALPPGNRPGTHCTGHWVGPEPVWTCAENLASTGMPSADRAARSQSVH